jgi:hypothetical protein
LQLPENGIATYAVDWQLRELGGWVQVVVIRHRDDLAQAVLEQRKNSS